MPTITTITMVLAAAILILYSSRKWIMRMVDRKSYYIPSMLSYMNEKYPGEEFVYAGATGEGADIMSAMVSSSSYPDKEVYVHCYTRDGAKTGTEFEDDFIGIKYEKQTYETIKSLLERVTKSNVFITYHVTEGACPNKDGNMTFEEYISLRDSYIGFVAVINKAVDVRWKFIDELKAAIREVGLCAQCVIYFEEDAEEFSKIEDSNLQDYMENGSYTDVVEISMESNRGFREVKWGK